MKSLTVYVIVNAKNQFLNIKNFSRDEYSFEEDLSTDCISSYTEGIMLIIDFLRKHGESIVLKSLRITF